MTKAASITFAGTILLLSNCFTAIAGDTYYPYQSYEEYHKEHTSRPPPSEPPASQPRPEVQVKPPPQPEQPAVLTLAPEFLFPKELGFGVAVGVPYDMLYISPAYYLLRGSSWYRSPSYRGPWTVQGLSQLPPELRKHKLAEIRHLRNREFRDLWEDKARYKGRRFRPGVDLNEAPKPLPSNRSATDR